MKRITVDNRLSDLFLPQAVENEARSIHTRLPDAVKRSKVDSQVYLIVTEAYKTLDKVCDIEALKKKIKISKGQRKAILKTAARSGYHPILKKYEPRHFFDDFCHHIGMGSSHYDSIGALVNMLMQSDDSYNETKPQEIAGGVILYYAYINAFEVDAKEFAKYCRISPSAITGIRKAISILHNA